MGTFAEQFSEITRAERWITTVLKVGADGKPVSDVESLRAEDLKQKAHSFLADLVVSAAKVISIYVKRAGETQQLSNELIESQKTVIALQQELIQVKDEQIKSVTSAVEEKLGEVKQEVRDYSAAVRSGISDSVQISHTKVKTAVRNALEDRADEEGREANVVVFGLAEETGEKVDMKLTELFGELGEKPKFSAKRIGESKEGDQKRPVKVTFRSSTISRQVLAKASKLRSSSKFSDVFISPDRTPDQRAKQRELVVELKKRRAEDRGKNHFIRGDRVVTTDVK